MSLQATSLLHPAMTLLQRPALARHVKHVCETGTVFYLIYVTSHLFWTLFIPLGIIHTRAPSITPSVLAALQLCTNLSTFTWKNDLRSPPHIFEAFLAVISHLSIRALILRTYSDLGSRAWTILNGLTGLHKLAVWCMEGPPRVLQGWAGFLGPTLKELDLGVRLSCYHSIILILVVIPALRRCPIRYPHRCSLATPTSARSPTSWRFQRHRTRHSGPPTVPSRPRRGVFLWRARVFRVNCDRRSIVVPPPAPPDCPHTFRRSPNVGMAGPAHAESFAPIVRPQRVLVARIDLHPTRLSLLAYPNPRKDHRDTAREHGASHTRGRQVRVLEHTKPAGALVCSTHSERRASLFPVSRL